MPVIGEDVEGRLGVGLIVTSNVDTRVFDHYGDPHVARDIVGHSALDVTMNIYAHADMTEKRAALHQVGSLRADE
ncbi:hypothetical protein [Streptomyces sp. NPDC001340]